jgi:glycine reductase complex component B subunit gamma
MGNQLRVALYLNQFFGQLGGEEAAGSEPRIVEEVIGPGRALAGLLAADEQLVCTAVCGDNYFAEDPDGVAQQIVELLRPFRIDLLLAGPAFNAGRYGTACGALCEAVQRELNIRAVSAMYSENPAVELYRRSVLILKAGENARLMRETLSRMLTLGRRLVAQEPLAKPHEDRYFPQGRLEAKVEAKPAAARAVDMLLEKLAGRPYFSEVQLPAFRRTPAPPPVTDLRNATIALVTDGGLVPLGNPDGIEGYASTNWGAYSVDGVDRLDPADYEISHGGYDPRDILADPHRLVGLDVARELEREGAFGRLHPAVVSTGGLANPVENSKRLGREIADYLRKAGVDGVILTST